MEAHDVLEHSISPWARRTDIKRVKNRALLVPSRMYTNGMRLWSRFILQVSEDVVGAGGGGELSFSATCRVQNIASVLE